MLKKILGNKKLVSDVILIGSLLLVALSVFLITRFNVKDGDTVGVYVGDKLVAKYDLNTDGEYSLNGGTNILVIEDGYAYFNCPDKTCVLGNSVFGKKIHKVNEAIMCEPNKVVVKILGEINEDDMIG